MELNNDPALVQAVADFVREGFKPRFGKVSFDSIPLWQKMRDLGTELWLDTGSIADAETLFCSEFSALTTNNTLLNKEIQTGTYDELIPRAAELLDGFPDLSGQQRRLEIAFILNAYHGLRLVERFDAMVSVEEHTDLANELEAAVSYGLRYHAICPERFIVKLPMTPAGILGTRRLAVQGVTINHTLGFAARQNYLIARVGKPAFVNVFLGRLNAFVSDNELGDGTLVGERATVATQQMLRDLAGSETRLIAASLRSGQQIHDLAGTDVMTMPPKAAQEFVDAAATDLQDMTGHDYQPPLADGVDPKAVRLETLWDVDASLITACDALDESGKADTMTADDLVDFLAEHGCSDLLVRWSDPQIATSTDEGKIPNLGHWRDELAAGTIGLDALMNLAGLNSFREDQKAMDQRVSDVLAK